MDHACPRCSKPIPSRELAGQSRRVPYRTCPWCETLITQDPETRRRQVVGLAIGMAALAATVVATVRSGPWWVGAAGISVALLVWIAHAERRVEWVHYAEPES